MTDEQLLKKVYEDLLMRADPDGVVTLSNSLFQELKDRVDPKEPFCPKCKSREIHRNATGWWNHETRAWDYGTDIGDFEYWCHGCNGPIGSDEIEMGEVQEP